MGLPQLTDEDVEAARILMSFRRTKAGTELPVAARPSLLSSPPSVVVWGGDGDDAGSSGVEDAEFRLGYTHRQSYLDEAQGEEESERETEVQQTARFAITPEGKACLVFA